MNKVYKMKLKDETYLSIGMISFKVKPRKKQTKTKF
jgi:hypothetical protein